MATRIRAKQVSLAAMLAGTGLAAACAGAVFAEQPSAIPPLMSADFGWQSNDADWQDPPPGYGRGPIKPDPAHPFTSNAEAARTNTQPTKRLGNARDPVLKHWAAAQMLASNEEVLRGERDIPFAAQARCWPGGVPGQDLWPFEPFYVIQRPNEVIMMWQRDHQIRRIQLTDHHSAHVKPSWFGESIGHYENGDTLVVDTVGVSTDTSYIDNFRTPHTDRLHVVERFTLEPDGKHLTALVRVEDPGAFNEPMSMVQRWTKVAGSMSESICAENNGDFYHQNLFPMPEAKTPDF